MLNKKRLSAKGLTFALLALGGLGVASHNNQAHASSVKPSVSYTHRGKAKSNTKQMNFLAHPKTHKVATSQRTPRIVTARGMVKPNKVAKTAITAIKTKLNRVNKPKKQAVNTVRNTVKPTKVVNKVTTTKAVTRKSKKTPKKSVGFAKGLSQHTLNKQEAQKQNYNDFMQQRQSDRSGVKWNTRDLGNYQVKGGHIKPHMIYRSSRLNSMSPTQVKRLQKMGVTKIIDLRQKTDRMNHFDTDEQGGSIPGTKIKYEIAPVFTRAQRRQMGKISNFYKGPAVDSARAKKSYRKVFHTLLTNKGATLFHCDSGQDRTGVVSALVMSSLGANRNEVTNDYLLSNAYRRHPQSVRAQKAQINNFYKVINHQYGNMNNYLHKGLGLTNKQINKLRNKYVQKNGAKEPVIAKSTKKATPLKAVKATSATPKSVSASTASQAPKSASVSATNASTASNSNANNKGDTPILDVLGPRSQSSSVAPKSVASSAPQSVQSTAPVKMVKANPVKKVAKKPAKKQASNVYHVNGKYSISKNTWRAYQLPKSVRRYVVSPKHVGMHYGSHKGWSDPGIWSVNFANSYFHKIWNTKNGTAYGNGNSLNRGWHKTMKGYITNKAHVGALGSSTNRALTGGNQFGHSFVVQHVFKNGYALVVEENWPKMTGYRGGNNDRWNYAVIPSQMKGTTYFMPKGYRLNMGNKVHKATKRAKKTAVKLNATKSSATKSTATKPATQSASSSASKPASSASNRVPTDNITRVLNNVTKNVQQQSQTNHTNTQNKPVTKLSNLRKNKVASNKASHSNKEVTYMYQDGNNVVQGKATMAQINANKKLPKNTAIINNSPKTVKTNLSESYKTALKNINNYRQANGLKPLQISHKLNKLATMRATQLESHWGHYYKGVPLENDDARKLGLYKTNDDAGYHLSENIAESPLSPNEVMPSDPKSYNTENGSKLATADDDAMFNYDGHEGNWSHRTNMLNPYATKIGIGTRYNAKTGMYYIAEDFYQPKTLTSNQQYDNYVNAAMKSLSKKDYTESDKLACQQAGKDAKNKVLANHGSRKQANRAYKSAFVKQMKAEIKK